LQEYKHSGQFHFPVTLEPERRTPYDPVDLHHTAELPFRPAEFPALTEQDDLKPAHPKKHTVLQRSRNPQKFSKRLAGKSMRKMQKIITSHHVYEKAFTNRIIWQSESKFSFKIDNY